MLSTYIISLSTQAATQDLNSHVLGHYHLIEIPLSKELCTEYDLESYKNAIFGEA